MSRLIRAALLLGSIFAFTAAVPAEDLDDFDVDATSPVNQTRQVRSAPRDDSWYYHPSTEATNNQPSPRQIVQQKAMARSQQRADRIASTNWYGMSNARPTAAPTPFTSMYSPAWQMPGGRPYAWFAGRPTYIFR